MTLPKLDDLPDVVFIIGGVVSSFVSALYAHRLAHDMAKTLSDAVMCSLFTTGITLALHSAFDWSYASSVLIGCFVGSLGTKAIINAMAYVLVQRGLFDDEKPLKARTRKANNDESK